MKPTYPTLPYPQYESRLPQTGKHILALQQEDTVVVYQAYKPEIAEYAVQHQQLGGPHFSYSRMSWVKPNFLWMMYRCGWATKENQERVLALWVSRQVFEHWLGGAVLSSYKPQLHGSQEQWKALLANSEVRLQWDPDHDPFGRPLERRALQLGLRGKTLEDFGKRHLRHVEDITEFVQEQHEILATRSLDKLRVPEEKVYLPDQVGLKEKLGLDEA